MEEVTCAVCGGTGWEVIKDGGVERARRCGSCSHGHDSTKLAAAAKIPERFNHCIFDNYEPQSFQQKRVLALSRSYAADYPLLDEETFAEKSLLYTGAAGRGKTHLAVSVLKALLQKGVPCLFIDFHRLLLEIRGTYDEVSQNSEYELLQPVLNTEVLVLDDLGSTRMTDWMQDTVFQIINQRYNQMKPLIITTNLAMEPARGSQMATLQDRLGYRVVSRLYEMCTTLELDGPDYRKDVRKAGADFRRRQDPGATQ